MASCGCYPARKDFPAFACGPWATWISSASGNSGRRYAGPPIRGRSISCAGCARPGGLWRTLRTAPWPGWSARCRSGGSVLCHLAVRDDHRNMGPWRLSAWAVAYLRSQGAGGNTTLLDPAGRGCTALGFRPCAPRTVYRLDEATRTGGGEDVDGHSVGTLSFGDLPELYGLDHWSYGADRSALIFATLRLHPGEGLIARDSSGRIKGYLLRSYSGRVDRIGPFVASTPDVARLLLAAALRSRGGSPVEVTVPGVAESPAHELFREFGFRDAVIACRWSSARRAGFRMDHYGTTPYLAA